MKAEQYDKLSRTYTTLTETDPVFAHVHYPNALRLLGGLRDRTVLDVGCGNGFLAREMAKRGAKVTGYDPSPGQIRLAREEERRRPLGIMYYVSDRALPRWGTFDKAIASMVLPYAKDMRDLEKMLRGVFSVLSPQGKLSITTYNPAFKRFGEVVYRRRFTRTGPGTRLTEFFRGDRKVMSASASDFSVSDYRTALKHAGFSKVRFVALRVMPRDRGNARFWKGFEGDPPYVGIRATKTL